MEAGEVDNAEHFGARQRLQAKIERLLRLDYDTFINSALLLQGRADEFTTHTPADRKRVLADILGLQPGEVCLVAAHNNDLAAARACGLKTAFVPRPLEHGPGQVTDLKPEGPWDVVAADFPDLADRLGC